MLIAATADSQVDEHSRLEEHDRVMEFIARDAERRGCELMIHAGDIFERRSTVRERGSVGNWCDMVTEVMPLFVCGGNHETVGEVAELTVSSGAHPIISVERPGTPWNFTGATDDTSVQCLPWPRRATLLQWLRANGIDASREDVNARGLEFLRDLLRDMADRWQPGTARVLVAHAMVRGSLAGPDQPPLLGCDFELGLEDLMLADPDVVILGHVHMPQDWTMTAADGRIVPIIYTGSPRRTAYSSGEQVEKSYVVIEFDGRRLVKWERVPTPATPMVLLEAEFNSATSEFDIDWGPYEVSFPMRAEIRFRYSVDAELRGVASPVAAALAFSWEDQYGAEVKIEERVRPTVRARAPEIAEARNLDEKLRAFWNATDPEMTDEKRDRLLGRLATLEGE